MALGIETEPAREEPGDTVCLMTEPLQVECEASAAEGVAPSLVWHGFQKTQEPKSGREGRVVPAHVHRTDVSRKYAPTQRKALSRSTHSHMHTLSLMTFKAPSSP